ncbi:MAG: FAD-binding monooxygenase [Polyangiaceae bacterium]|nr:FAD-binding monooxygenase [Polyangiaceae bacterium]
MHQDVVIVGAGPVGLFLAIELAVAGVRPLVVERLLEPDRTIKAGGVGAVAAEALERRGLAPALDDEARATMALMGPALQARFGAGAVKRPGGHFSGLFLIDQSNQRDPHRRMRFVAQEPLERILAARANELGVEVRRGVTMEAFEQTDGGVTVQTSAGPLDTKYLVGCDGGRSRVRKLAGFEFPGTDATITGYQAIVELDAPEKLAPGWHRTPRGLIASGPMLGRVFTAEFNGPPPNRDAPITQAEVEAAIQRVSGTDVKIRTMTMATRWTDNARQATTYRMGRILLAGDAAHVHSPFGGQGLNLGLVDAANLGWKLAAALKGRDNLLDSYTAERHPVAARVLENTRAQVALMRPDPLTSALRTIVSDLMKLPEGNRYFGEMLSGVDIRYDLGDDPLLGTLAKDQLLTLSNGGEERLYVLMEKGGGLFISPSERSLPTGVRHAHTKDGISMLVRPDGCIAWTDASSNSVDDALARWF